jgi:hypothetical protein
MSKYDPDIKPDITPPRPYYGTGSSETNGDKVASDLDQQESAGQKPDVDNSIDEQESRGGATWRVNVKDELNKYEARRNVGKAKAYIRLAKRKGPLTAIILTVIGGSIGIGALLSPGLLLVHFKEVLVTKFNSQLASMDIRTNKLLVSKMRNTTSGICGNVVTIRCKYSSMSAKQIAKFEKAGIKVEIDTNASTLTGRSIVKELKFDNKVITAASLASEIDSNPQFRSALKTAYNPKWAGFSDSAWKKAANFLRVNKKAPTFEGDDYDDKMKNLQEDLAKETKIEKTGHVSGDDIDPDTGRPYSEGSDPNTKLKEANKNIDALNELVDMTGGDGSLTGKIFSGAKEVVGVIKITGVLDDICTVYRTFLAIGYAAKTVRVVQLANFAMKFLNVADQIKAGNAKEKDVEFLANILTKQSRDDDDNLKSATDSFGYKYAAYGERGKMQTSTMKYLVGGGTAGAMTNFFEAFPAPAKTTCSFLNNPVVGIVSFVVGLGVTIFSGGTSAGFNISVKAAIKSVKLASKAALKNKAFWKGLGEFTGNAVLGLSEIFLPSLLSDIVSGNLVDDTTVGANAGDGLTSGASGIMTAAAKYGGNAPLTPEQAVSYANLSSNVAAEYAEEDTIAYSPLDITNNNTFVGRIAASLIPYASKMSSLSGTISSLASMTTQSLSSIVLPVRAASTDEFTMCQDYEYHQMNIATDPYCNVRYGIPPEALNADPLSVTEALLNQKDKDGDPLPQIDLTNGNPISKYAEFVSECIERRTPLGSTFAGDATNGERCMFGAKYPIDGDYAISNKNFYIHYIDQRVNDGMEGA